MNFAFTDEQELLRETARRFLDDKVPSEIVRKLMESHEGYDPAHWAEVAQMGWQAMAIPEEYGGAGFSFLETVVLMEEMGRSVVPLPFLSTVILSANLLLELGSEDQKSEYLPGIAAGESIWAMALTEPGGQWDAEAVETVASPAGDGWQISGTKAYVIDGHIANHLLVVARTGAPGEVSVFIVDADAEGVNATKVESMDQTRCLALVDLEDVRVDGSALVGSAGEAWDAVDTVLDIAAVALAAEQVGGAQTCLDMSVEYAKVRMQFGRPIGSFQAIKHKCADMLVQVESARSAAYYAGWATAERNDEFAVTAPLAKSYCSEAYFFCAAENIQIHGGIGFTWEHDAHLYFKRAKSSELMFGDPTYHRSRLADRIGI